MTPRAAPPRPSDGRQASVTDGEAERLSPAKSIFLRNTGKPQLAHPPALQTRPPGMGVFTRCKQAALQNPPLPSPANLRGSSFA
ncbi:hypothetical protein GN956_G9126 [Arapaima gigas]